MVVATEHTISQIKKAMWNNAAFLKIGKRNVCLICYDSCSGVAIDDEWNRYENINACDVIIKEEEEQNENWKRCLYQSPRA